MQSNSFSPDKQCQKDKKKKKSTDRNHQPPAETPSVKLLLLGLLACPDIVCFNHSILKSMGITRQRDPTEQSVQPNLQLPSDATLLFAANQKETFDKDRFGKQGNCQETSVCLLLSQDGVNWRCEVCIPCCD